MKIESITLENYRFFQDQQTFEFGGNNVLLYGENGSGKSSLFYALQKLFRYYRDPDNAKENIKDAQNIFVDSATEKPKIIIKIGDKTITFDENGLDDDSLKDEIENTGKSKLFLTYKDVYAINAIFQENLTYKEFKNIFVTLFNHELYQLFEDYEHEESLILFDIKDTLVSIKEQITEIKTQVEQFDFDFEDTYEPIPKEVEGDIIPNIIDTVFYLDDSYVEKIQSFISDFSEYIGFDFDEYNDFDVINSLDEISLELSKYTYVNVKYADDQVSEERIVLDYQVIENDPTLDRFIDSLDDLSRLIQPILKCKRITDSINERVHINMNSLIPRIKDILKYLKSNIEVKSIPKREYILFDHDFLYQKNVYSIDMQIEFAGKILDNHSQNLNEAKMSALNTAIYFAAVMEKKPDIPILVLDDLMISLDMSNRAKMLEFLLDKSNFDETYQMMIFTHDRAFFETAKRVLDGRELGHWKYFEMYVETNQSGDLLLEAPFVRNLSQPYGNLELAQEHFKKREYPPTANYLRKEVERLVDKYLQLDNLDQKILLSKLKNNNEHIRKFAKESQDIITQLEKLKNIDSLPEGIRIDKCKQFAEQLIKLIEKNKYVVDNFKIGENEMLERVHFALKDILHPQSHNDLTKPLYKKELEDALAILKTFKEQVDELIDQ